MINISSDFMIETKPANACEYASQVSRDYTNYILT